MQPWFLLRQFWSNLLGRSFGESFSNGLGIVRGTVHVLPPSRVRLQDPQGRSGNPDLPP